MRSGFEVRERTPFSLYVYMALIMRTKPLRDQTLPCMLLICQINSNKDGNFHNSEAQQIRWTNAPLQI